MKKTSRMLSILIAVVLICSAVSILAACAPKTFTVTYHNWEGEKIGTETVEDKAFATGKVTGYALEGSMYTMDGKIFPLDTPITADISLKGHFVVTNSWLDDKGNYTWRGVVSVVPTNWNYHTYTESSATSILDYTSDTLYTFDYNDAGNAYQIVPSMASGMPVDVSAEYAEEYGYDATLTGKAYKIPLKDNLKYDNGDAINANSFVKSVEHLLNPEAANSRADELYAYGDVKILGAENYLKQGKTLVEAVNSGALPFGNLDGAIAAGQEILIDMTVLDDVLTNEWFGLGYSGLVSAGYINAYFSIYAGEGENRAATGENFFTKWFDPIINTMGEETSKAVEWTAEQVAELKSDWANVDDFASDMGDSWSVELYNDIIATEYTLPTVTMADVGFKAISDYELLIVLVNPMEQGFYLMYELCTSYFLVHNAKYEQCIDTEGGVYNNTYATGLNSYVGYGPYKLTEYVADNEFKFERNEYWHGYYEEELAGQYQTTAISYKKVTDEELIKEMFLRGQIESYGLRPKDMQDFGGSKYVYYDEGTSTWFIAMNPNVEKYNETAAKATPATAGNTVIKAPLAIKEFRQALSYSLDRQAFCLAVDPLAAPAKGAISASIIYDPDIGLAYRESDEAKDAILNYWGLSDKWGEGKDYATRDDAIDAITGYDPEGAKALFITAYEKAVAAGYIPEGDNWELQICIGASSWASSFYSGGFVQFQRMWTKGVEDTPWEGHLVLTQSAALGQEYANELKAGNVDMLFFVGWRGSTFNPYSLLNCFMRDDLAYDSFTDKDAVDLDITIDGQVLRASLKEWLSDALQGKDIEASVIGSDGNPTGEKVTINAGASADSALRLKIMAACEVACLNICNMLPLSTDSSASLRCMRINYKTEEYILGLGRGGLQYYTYTMTDEEFAEFVTEQGGTLDYTITE